jgi:hypothetical protein
MGVPCDYNEWGWLDKMLLSFCIGKCWSLFAAVSWTEVGCSGTAGLPVSMADCWEYHYSIPCCYCCYSIRHVVLDATVYVFDGRGLRSCYLRRLLHDIRLCRRLFCFDPRPCDNGTTSALTSDLQVPPSMPLCMTNHSSAGKSVGRRDKSVEKVHFHCHKAAMTTEYGEVSECEVMKLRVVYRYAK